MKFDLKYDAATVLGFFSFFLGCTLHFEYEFTVSGSRIGPGGAAYVANFMKSVVSPRAVQILRNLHHISSSPI